MRIIKRNSSEETFNGGKIVNAVTKLQNMLNINVQRWAEQYL